MKTLDVIIIGAGPAGIAAAIQLKRYGISPLLIERDEVGGLLRSANIVENYPGFPAGISGPGLVTLLQRHLDRVGVKPVSAAVKSLEYQSSLFHVKTGSGDYCSRIVIVATGTCPNEVSISGLEAVLGKQAFYEIHPLRQVSGKQITVIGAGDAAFDYALNLAGNDNRVIIHNRGRRLSCLPLLWERANKNNHIEYKEESILQEITSDGNGLSLSWKRNEDEILESCDFLLLATGRNANLDFIARSMHSQVRSLTKKCLLYLVGDVKNDRFRQASIAVGEGIKAAMMISRKLGESR